MCHKKVGSVCIFLALSLAAHFTLLYLALEALVATQSNSKSVVHSIQDISILSGIDHAEGMTLGIMPRLLDAVTTSKLIEKIPAQVVRPSAKFPEKVAADVPSNKPVNVSTADIVMLPVMQARELLASGINLFDFKNTERLHPLSFNPRYFEAGHLDKRAKAQKNLVPLYPQDAYDANRQGRVIAELLINAEGKVDASLIIAATDGFEESAAEALRGMSFVPAEIGGIKVASRLLVEMDYRMINPSFSSVDSEDVVPVGSFDKPEK